VSAPSEDLQTEDIVAKFRTSSGPRWENSGRRRENSRKKKKGRRSDNSERRSENSGCRRETHVVLYRWALDPYLASSFSL